MGRRKKRGPRKPKSEPNTEIFGGWVITREWIQGHEQEGQFCTRARKDPDWPKHAEKIETINEYFNKVNASAKAKEILILVWNQYVQERGGWDTWEPK